MRLLGVVLLFVWLGSLPGCSPGNPDALSELEDRIQEEFDQVEGTFGLAFQHLDEPELQLFLHADTLVHAASTYKTAVMIEVFRQAEEGRFSMDDRVPVENEFRSIVDGSTFELDEDIDGEHGLFDHVGDSLTVRELTRHMIVVSGNLATNLLIEKVGAEAVTQTMRDLGAQQIQVRRGVYDMKAFEEGLNNETSARALAVMFQALADGRALNETHTDEALAILKAQEFTNLIPAPLPEDVLVAHKTGSISGVEHDSGIVYLPDGQRYVLVMLSTGLADEEAGIDAIATVSRYLYEFVAGQGQ